MSVASGLDLQRVQVSLGFVLFLCGVVGCFGNGTLAWAIVRTPDLRSKNGLLLCLLAFSDGLLSTLNIFYGLDFLRVSLLGYSPLSIQGCFGLFLGPRLFCFTSSTMLTSALALDRLLMVKRPIGYRNLSWRKYVGLWSLAAVSVALFLVVTMRFVLDPEFGASAFCDHMFMFENKDFDTFLVMPLNVGCVVVVLVVSVWSLCWVESALNESTSNLERMQRFQSSMRIVLLIFLSSWVVTVALAVGLTLLDPIVDHENPLSLGQLVAVALIAIVPQPNICSNFFIYYFRNPEYRRAIRGCLRIAPGHVDTAVAVFTTRKAPSQIQSEAAASCAAK